MKMVFSVFASAEATSRANRKGTVPTGNGMRKRVVKLWETIEVAGLVELKEVSKVRVAKQHQGVHSDPSLVMKLEWESHPLNWTTRE